MARFQDLDIKALLRKVFKFKQIQNQENSHVSKNREVDRAQEVDTSNRDHVKKYRVVGEVKHKVEDQWTAKT